MQYFDDMECQQWRLLLPLMIVYLGLDPNLGPNIHSDL